MIENKPLTYAVYANDYYYPAGQMYDIHLLTPDLGKAMSAAEKLVDKYDQVGVFEIYPNRWKRCAALTGEHSLRDEERRWETEDLNERS